MVIPCDRGQFSEFISLFIFMIGRIWLCCWDH